MFSCEYCANFKNSFFYRTPLVAASALITYQHEFYKEVALKNFIKSQNTSQGVRFWRFPPQVLSQDLFFNWNSLHARLNSHYEICSYKTNKYKKIKAYKKFVQKEPTVKRCLKARLKAIQIIGRRKAFYRQRIPESSCVRKKTVNIDILVTSMNGDRKIMQSI